MRGFGDGGLAVVGMHEIDVRPREQLVPGVAESRLPRGIQVLEITVGACDAEKVERKFGELAEIQFGGLIESRREAQMWFQRAGTTATVILEQSYQSHNRRLCRRARRRLTCVVARPSMVAKPFP